MPLNSLPTELLLHIQVFAGPVSAVSIALTCKSIAAQLQDVLLHHQYCSKHYRTFQEEDQASFDMISQDPIAAWHVRTFRQVTHFRAMLRMGQANTADYIEPETDTDDIQGVSMKAEQRFELEQFCDAVNSQKDYSQVGGRAHIMATKRSAQNVLVFAMCPNIRCWQIKRPFRATSMDFVAMRGPAASGRASFNAPYLARVICVQHSFTAPQWLPGFESLRRITIGATSRPDPEPTVTRVGEVLPLFLLPQLRTVYIRGLCLDRKEGSDWARYGERSSLYRLRSDCSTVRNVCLEQPFQELVKLVIENIIDGCRRLENFVVKSCGFNNFDGSVARLTEKHGSSLQAFYYYGDPNDSKDYRGTMLEGFDMSVTDLSVIRILAMNLETFMKNAPGRHQSDRHDRTKITKDNEREHLKERYDLMHHLGDHVGSDLSTLEVLIVQVQAGSTFDKNHIQLIDETFARLLKPTLTDNGVFKTEKRTYHRLKVVYLDLVVDAALFAKEFDYWQRTSLFPKTQGQARLRRVQIHVKEDSAKTYMQSRNRRIFKI